MQYVHENLRELGVAQVDLVLVHRPCQASQTNDVKASNQALWDGMLRVFKQNLTRAIGISNYEPADIEVCNSLFWCYDDKLHSFLNSRRQNYVQALDFRGVVPAVNQFSWSVEGHNEEQVSANTPACVVHQTNFLYNLTAHVWVARHYADQILFGKGHRSGVLPHHERFFLENVITTALPCICEVDFFDLIVRFQIQNVVVCTSRLSI